MKKSTKKSFYLIFGCLILVLTSVFVPFQNPETKAEVGGEITRITPTPAELPQPAADRIKSAVILFTDSPVAFVNNEQTLIDIERPAARPVVISGRTLVPLRFISTAFGAEYTFNENTKTARITAGENVITFDVGEDSLLKNGVKTAMDTAPIELDETLYVPLRSFADAIDKFTFYSRGLIVISDTENILDASKDKELIDSLIKSINNLPVLGTEENLIALIGDPNAYKNIYSDDLAVNESAAGRESGPSFAQEAESPTAGAADPAPAPGSTNQTTAALDSGADYSATNIQVQGVDEGDVLKTDGEYIYYVRGNSIAVIKAVPGEQMKLDYTVKYNDNFTPQELYVDGNDLVVIGQTYTENIPISKDGAASIMPYYWGRTQTTALTYDISDKSNVKKVREVTVDGRHLSSRKIGSVVYMTSITSIYELYIQNGDEIDIMQPSYKDTAVSPTFRDIGYDRIYYFPDIVDQSYTMITSFNVKNKATEAKVNTYLGGGQDMYVSQDNMYVSTVNYNYSNIRPLASSGAAARSDVRESYWSPKTTIYKFALSNGNVEYSSKAYVEGTILNQFSMDEHNGFFRVATTSYGQRGQMVNNLLIFDKNMKETGKINNIAPNERIYSARFMGNRGYMVTFQVVDPLFAMDLSDPYNPKILGKLKIPGYSEYLHPYDENHLIGFGRDAVEAPGGNFAYMLGMKISLFDVSDINNPIEKFTEFIGDRGTDSELLRNHKALLFSREKSLMAFPVQLYVVNQSDSSRGGTPPYGEFKTQAAFVYNIDLETGFTLKGTISHLDDQSNYGYYGNYDNYVQRIMYIGDTLYTVSNSQVKANSINDLSELGALNLK